MEFQKNDVFLILPPEAKNVKGEKRRNWKKSPKDAESPQNQLTVDMDNGQKYMVFLSTVRVHILSNREKRTKKNHRLTPF